MKRFRLTKGAKILIMILVIALIGGGIFMGLKTGIVKNDLKPDADGNVINTTKESADTINLSLDEWIGWKSIIDANGGLSTEKGSIYDELGINCISSCINLSTYKSIT